MSVAVLFTGMCFGAARETVADTDYGLDAIAAGTEFLP